MKSLQVLLNTGETAIHFRLHVVEYSACNNCSPVEPVKSSFIASRSLDMLKKFHCVLIATPVYQSEISSPQCSQQMPFLNSVYIYFLPKEYSCAS